VTQTEKVWLIGAQSFTGQYLMPALEKAGYQVETARVDITDRPELITKMLAIQPDYIINLAAISFVPDGDNSLTIYNVNTLGAQNILEASLKLLRRPKRIILASSAHIYGNQTQEKISESNLANPISHYGCSKWAMEQIAKTYTDRLDIIITRPFNYTGKGQDAKFLVPKIVQHFQQKAPAIKLGNIDIWRDFSDVRWISEAYVALLSVPDPSACHQVNLCSAQLISIREIIEYLQQITGHVIRIEVDSQFVRAADMRKQCGDNSNLFTLLPDLPRPNNFKTVLSWMV